MSRRSTKGPGDVLTVPMKYSPERDRTITGLRRVSTPGLRVYRKADGSPRAGRSRCGRPVHQLGADDRPRGASATWAARSSVTSGDRRNSMMSRIGKAPITVPSGVDVTVDGRTITVKGPKGTLSRDLPGDHRPPGRYDLMVERPDDERENRSLHGLTRTLVNNMVVGVTDGFAKELEIIGVGYRAEAQGPNTSARARLQPPGHRQGARRHHLRGSGADSGHRPRHRQRTRRPGGREHPQHPQAGALQGQGRGISRRKGPAQSRQDRQEVSEEGTEFAMSDNAKVAVSPLPPTAGPQEDPWHGRAAPPGRVPLEQAPRAAGHRRRGREHVGVGLDQRAQRPGRRHRQQGRRSDPPGSARSPSAPRLPASRRSSSTAVGSPTTDAWLRADAARETALDFDGVHLTPAARQRPGPVPTSGARRPARV